MFLLYHRERGVIDRPGDEPQTACLSHALEELSLIVGRLLAWALDLYLEPAAVSKLARDVSHAAEVEVHELWLAGAATEPRGADVHPLNPGDAPM